VAPHQVDPFSAKSRHLKKALTISCGRTAPSEW